MSNPPRLGIGVLIINGHNQILLGKRKNSHGEKTWAPPGGHLEFGESFEDCAIREVAEETGLKIEQPHFVGITNSIFTDEEKHYVSIFMTAKYPLNQDIHNCEPHKVEDWQWFSIKDLPKNLFLTLKQLIDQEGIKKLFES
jgi:8-oxo-dGTP diphosphatase